MRAHAVRHRGADRTESLASLPTAAGGAARAAYQRVQQAGIKVDPLLAAAGLTQSQLRRRDTRIPVRSQIKFLDEAARRLDDDFLGMRLAQGVDLREIGLVYYVIASSPDLRTALQRVARYSSINNEGVRIDVRTGKDFTLSFAYLGVARSSDRHQIEFFVAILVRLCRYVTGRHLLPLRIRLMHRRAKLAPDLTTFFGCPVEFGAPRDQVVLPGAIAAATLTHADPYLNEMLLRYCDDILATRRAKPGGWRLKVENAIVPLLPQGEATRETAAGLLAVCCRTLARRLSESGVSFVEVLQELRQRLATEYLREPDIDMTQIAWLLGYRGASAFSHAYKSWTGRPPREIRSQVRCGINLPT